MTPKGYPAPTRAGGMPKQLASTPENGFLDRLGMTMGAGWWVWATAFAW